LRQKTKNERENQWRTTPCWTPPSKHASGHKYRWQFIQTHLRNHPLDALAAKPATFIGGRQPAEKSKMPEHLFAIPGVLNTVVDYYNQTALQPQPGFAVQTALCIGSVILARRFKTVPDNFSSLYFLNISGAASGKEHNKTVVTRVLRKVCHPQRRIPS
jgi:hypothetical protein